MMKIGVWAVFGLLATLWTGGALLVSELTKWGAQLLAAGGAPGLGKAAAQWPTPHWMSAWVDPAWMQAAQDVLVSMLEALPDSLPVIGSAMEWVAPLVWIVWGLGLALLLVMAGGAHVLLGRYCAVQRRMSQ